MPKRDVQTPCSTAGHEENDDETETSRWRASTSAVTMEPLHDRQIDSTPRTAGDDSPAHRDLIDMKLLGSWWPARKVKGWRRGRDMEIGGARRVKGWKPD